MNNKNNFYNILVISIYIKIIYLYFFYIITIIMTDNNNVSLLENNLKQNIIPLLYNDFDTHNTTIVSLV